METIGTFLRKGLGFRELCTLKVHVPKCYILWPQRYPCRDDVKAIKVCTYVLVYEYRDPQGKSPQRKLLSGSR